MQNLIGIPESDFTDAMRQLYELMSDLSEEAFCAGWIQGNEYGLWHSMQSKKSGGDARYGYGVITDDDIQTLFIYAEQLNGWIIWLDDYAVPGLPVEYWGARFIDMETWLKRYEHEFADY